MSGEMRQLGMQLASKVFDKFSDWISYVGHQSIAHHQMQIIRCSRQSGTGVIAG